MSMPFPMSIKVLQTLEGQTKEQILRPFYASIEERIRWEASKETSNGQAHIDLVPYFDKFINNLQEDDKAFLSDEGYDKEALVEEFKKGFGVMFNNMIEWQMTAIPETQFDITVRWK